MDRFGGIPPEGDTPFRHAVNNMAAYPSIEALESYLT
jgi:hypothetical protein